MRGVMRRAAFLVTAATWAGGLPARGRVHGTAALNQGGFAGVFFSVSCASAGNCSAGGNYTDSSGHSQASPSAR
jgi:hypothetical protein